MAYEINININGDFEETGAAGNVAGVSKTDTAGKSKEQKALMKYVAAQTIEPFIQNVKTQISQNVQTVTGNADLQQRINFGFQVVQLGVNTVKNAALGASLASKVGISSGAGALIGVALVAVETGLSVAFNASQINVNKRVESYQLQQVRDRQGVAYNKSRS